MYSFADPLVDPLAKLTGDKMGDHTAGDLGDVNESSVDLMRRRGCSVVAFSLEDDGFIAQHAATKRSKIIEMNCCMDSCAVP